MLPGFQTGFGKFGEAFEGRRAAKRAGRHGQVHVPGEPARRHRQAPAQCGGIVNVADPLKVGSGRERLGGVADRVGPPCRDEVVHRQGRVRVAVGIMEAHEAVLDTGDHHVMVRPDGGPGARMMQKR